MDDKVYTPVVIPDAPFPTQPQQPQASTSPSSNGVYTHQQIPDTPMPTKIIAHEVMNNVLNTKSKKILAEFQFTKMGAIQIGDFEEGQHGDVRISPDGITARNVNGEVTFALDGDTGDAVFKGIVQAADFTVIDEKGLVSLSSFSSDQVSNINQSTTSKTFVDIGISLSLDLIRDTHVLVGFDVTGRNDANTPPPTLSDFNYVALVVDNVTQDENKQLHISGLYFPNNGGGDTLLNQSASSTQILILGPGPHTLKLQMKTFNGGNGYLRFVNLYYITLGR